MTEHICGQAKKFEKLQHSIDVIQADREFQDKERAIRLAAREKTDNEINGKLVAISAQIQELLELNKEVKDFKTAWRVGKNIGFGLGAFIALMGVIFGGVLAIKNWINN